MKSARNVSAHDILYIATQFETMSNTLAGDKRQKAKTFLMFLASNCNLVQEKVNGKLFFDWLEMCSAQRQMSSHMTGLASSAVLYQSCDVERRRTYQSCLGGTGPRL